MHVQEAHSANPISTGCTADGWLKSDVQGLYIEKCYIQIEKTF